VRSYRVIPRDPPSANLKVSQPETWKDKSNNVCFYLFILMNTFVHSIHVLASFFCHDIGKYGKMSMIWEIAEKMKML